MRSCMRRLRETSSSRFVATADYRRVCPRELAPRPAFAKASARQAELATGRVCPNGGRAATRSVSDDSNGRLVNKGADRRKPPGRVDFAAINVSNRRDCRSANGLQSDTLWNQRTGDKNCHFFRLFAAHCDFPHRTTGEQGSTKHRDGDENY